MKKIFMLTALALVQCLVLTAQKMPRWVEKAKKAMLTVETYDGKGNVWKGNGFFVGEDGEAVSDYTLFEGATGATVTDAGGQRMEVTHVLGADDMYDVIRFRVAAPRKTPFLQVADGVPVAGEAVYVLPPVSRGGEAAVRAPVVEVSTIRETYRYFEVEAPLPAEWLSVPLLTADGRVFALAQADASSRSHTFGVSVPYVRSLHVGSMDLWNTTYASVGIRKAWPGTPQDAQVALMLYASQQDARAYLETLNDYIAHFPDSYDGYAKRASHYAFRRGDLAGADAEGAPGRMLTLAAEDMKTAHRYAGDRAAAYYDEASMIYGVVTGDSAALPAGWSLEVAEDCLRKAIEGNDRPEYHRLEGDMALYRDDYGAAYEAYMTVNRSAAASPNSFYMAAKAREQMAEHSPAEVIALLDSAAGRSLPSEALPYLEECAGLKMEAGMYDAAIRDYDRCYDLTAGNVSDAFYYLREQAKFRSGDLDGALRDIGAAVRMQPDNAVYHAEMASVYLRRQDPPAAQACVEKALAIDPAFASSHRLLGLCHLRQDRKDEACNAFRRAEELGDPVVRKLIRENCEAEGED